MTQLGVGVGIALDIQRPGKAGLRGLFDAIELAAEVGAVGVIMTTGRGGRLDWLEAADAFARAIEPVKRAASGKTHLLLEPTTATRTDISILHTLADACELAHQVDIDVDFDTPGCQLIQPGFEDAIALNLSRIPIAQICDVPQRLGEWPSRLVPGDGVLPLERMLAILLGAGYDGPVELKLVGPAIRAEGPDAAMRRGVMNLERLLQSASAG